MRVIAAATLMVLLSAPMLSQETLAPEEVGRFVLAVEDLTTQGYAPSDVLAASSGTLATLARFGFDERRWRILSSRIVSAQLAHRLASMAADPRDAERKLRQDPTLQPGERREVLTFVRAAHADVQALTLETADDRAVIEPFMHRLDRALVLTR